MIPAGVVIGSYGLPQLIKLQLRLLRAHCGDVPILVCDDCTPGNSLVPDRGSKFAELLQICHAHGAALWSSPDRLGHVGGDLASYYLGIQWARALGLDVLCKLSQRLLIDIPGWLASSASGLLASGHATGCQSCYEGPHRLPLRTECILFDTRRWLRADTLEILLPRPVRTLAAESMVHQAMQLIEPDFWPWPLFQERRTVRDPGIVWHCSHPRSAYEELASRHGVTLDDSFTVAGWQGRPNYC